MTFTMWRCQTRAWWNHFLSRLTILISFPHCLYDMALNAYKETVPHTSSSLSMSLLKCDNQKSINTPYSLYSKMPVAETTFLSKGEKPQMGGGRPFQLIILYPFTLIHIISLFPKQPPCFKFLSTYLYLLINNWAISLFLFIKIISIT